MLHEVEAIRARFPIFRNRVYLNSCSQGALCDAVADGMKALAASWDELGSPWDMWTERYMEARQAFARFIGAKPQEVAVLTSVSQGINAVASALDFGQRPTVYGRIRIPHYGACLGWRSASGEPRFNSWRRAAIACPRKPTFVLSGAERSSYRLRACAS